MSDIGAVSSGSETADSSPSPPRSQRRYLTPEWLTVVFTILLAVATVVLAGATVALVSTSIEQHRDAVAAIEETKRLAAATEKAGNDRREIASADLLLKYADILDRDRYTKITTDIQSHGSNYPLLASKTKGRRSKNTDADVEEYIGIFEDLGYFIEDNLIFDKMVYDHLSYDIEKAWCNKNVQRVIREARAADKSTTAQSDPMYGNFEKLAKQYLDREHQTCGEIETQ
jgi:hypothetical protein